jgi:hypothetical protein
MQCEQVNFADGEMTRTVSREGAKSAKQQGEFRELRDVA